ncbi:30S ribosomal protein 3, chloroplastic [Linum perenne]
MAIKLHPMHVSLKPLSQFSPSFLQQVQKRFLLLLCKPHKPSIKLSASPAESVDLTQIDACASKEKLRVVVKPMEKPRIVLQFLWMEDVIGVALNQVIPRHGTIPLTPYHFWPHQNACKELKLFLESKPWITHKQMNILLNQLAELINSSGKATDAVS